MSAASWPKGRAPRPTHPDPSLRDLDEMQDALTEGLRILAVAAKADAIAHVAMVADVRAVLVEWGGDTDMSAAHALAKIAAAVHR